MLLLFYFTNNLMYSMYMSAYVNLVQKYNTFFSSKLTPRSLGLLTTVVYCMFVLVSRTHVINTRFVRKQVQDEAMSELDENPQ